MKQFIIPVEWIIDAEVMVEAQTKREALQKLEDLSDLACLVYCAQHSDPQYQPQSIKIYGEETKECQEPEETKDSVKRQHHARIRAGYTKSIEKANLIQELLEYYEEE